MRQRMGLVVFVFLVMGLLFSGVSLAFDLAEKRVLVVHSYHETQKGHVVEMTQGIEEAFAGSGVEIRYVHMDTKRKIDLAWKKKAGQMAVKAVDEFNPAVVIAMDDNAQTYFVTTVMDRKNAPAFVFGGVNADMSVYGYPRTNVTGVLERPNIQESLDLLLKIRPGIKKILMIADKSRTTDLFNAYCKELDLPVTVVGYVQPLTLEDWEKTVMEYRDKVDAFGVYVLRTIQKEAGNPDLVPEAQLVDVLNQKGGLPTVGFFDTAAASGILCGISVSMKEQGYVAGAMALEILEGKKPSDFIIGPTHRGRIQLNLKTAEALGIDVAYRIISKADVVVK